MRGRLLHGVHLGKHLARAELASVVEDGLNKHRELIRVEKCVPAATLKTPHNVLQCVLGFLAVELQLLLLVFRELQRDEKSDPFVLRCLTL